MKVIDEKKIAEKRNQISEIAKGIIEKEGVDALSIRKISSIMNQTPGIIYHYFESKDSILLAIVQDGYKGILTILMNSFKKNLPADKQLEKTLIAYMEYMLTQPELYRMIMNSQHPILKKQSEILFSGVCEERKSMKMMKDCIEQGIQEGIFVCNQVERKAQSIWCCVYGLLDRCMKEKPSKNIEKELLHEMMEMILSSLRRMA